MKTNILLSMLIAILLLGCTSQTEDKKNEQTAPNVENVATDDGIQNFAVVWDWESDDPDYILNNLEGQIEDFNKLWERGQIENVYLNNFEIAKVNDDATMMTIMFFVKAENKKAAKAILDNMKFVKNKVATYRIYPVGSNWLGRNPEAAVDPKFSFAAVWNLKAPKEEIDKYVKNQFEQTVGLWNTGVIENAYFAMENSYSQQNDIPGMVYFVNADTEAEAKEILNHTIFYQKGIADYQLFPVGTFWRGSVND